MTCHEAIEKSDDLINSTTARTTRSASQKKHLPSPAFRIKTQTQEFAAKLKIFPVVANVAISLSLEGMVTADLAPLDVWKFVMSTVVSLADSHHVSKYLIVPAVLSIDSNLVDSCVQHMCLVVVLSAYAWLLCHIVASAQRWCRCIMS